MNLAVRQDHRVEGNAESAVRVVAYEDLQCSDCAAYRGMLDEHLLPKYGASVAFEHREFPLAKHPLARALAQAARYFDNLNLETGIAFRRYCFNNIADLHLQNFEARLRDFAWKTAASPAGVIAALKDPGFAEAVEGDYQEGILRGVARTPTVFVNGEPHIESFSVEDISRTIDAALAAIRTTRE
jgi:protein-disulfide isomerase